MKALQILENDNIFDERYISENIFYEKEIKEAIKELQELENSLKDLFKCIELTEDENSNERLNSMEIYLIRLSKYIK